MSLSFLVPTYNSDLTINKTIDQIESAVSKLENFEYEILIIDDFSSQNSYTLIEEILTLKSQYHYSLNLSI